MGLLKTSLLGLGFQQLPLDLAYVKAGNFMADPYLEFKSMYVCVYILFFEQVYYRHLSP